VYFLLKKVTLSHPFSIPNLRLFIDFEDLCFLEEAHSLKLLFRKNHYLWIKFYSLTNNKMNTLPSFINRFLNIIVFCFLLNPLASQAQKESVCENEDCLPEIFTIELNEPSKPADGNYAPQRTENFKAAFLAFQKISSQYNQNQEWKTKYESFQLGGINCLRHYKLESAFGHEYLQNADFKKFIDEQNGVNSELKEMGFASSRRALNLEKRMKSACPKEIKKVYLANLPTEYNVLGIDLGYFDMQGNILKPLPATEEDSKNIGKKEQVERLKAQVAGLAVGVQVSNKISALNKGLADLDVKQSALSKSNLDIDALLNTIFPKQANLQARLDGLKPNDDISSQKKEELVKALQNLTDDSNGLNNSFFDQKQELANLINTLNLTKSNLNDLTTTLSDLDRKKSELTALLDDKPKKILDELTQKVADAVKKSNKFSDKIKETEKTKDGLWDRLNKLIKSKGNLLDKLLNKDKQLDDLTGKTESFFQRILAKEKCKEDLVNVTNKLVPVSEKQTWFKKKMSQLSQKPQNLLQRISNIKNLHTDLKSEINLSTVAGQKLEFLVEKAKVLGEATKILLSKKEKLQATISTIDTKIDTAQKLLKNKEIELNAEENADCADLKEVEKSSEEIQNEQQTIEPQLKELEEDIKNTKEQTDEIEQDTKRATDLLHEEKRLQETYGKDIKLEPVSQKEWSESFAVKRQYWEAAFHPDNEVVQGFKGKYFQVKLKDAEKNVKLLFEPGKYFMSKSGFRDSYGATIGAFVSEALNFTKKDDDNKVILFIQGSADIVGQNTFKGKLDNDFLYTEVNVLPQKVGSESFGSNMITKNIPTQNFTNTDLPDLRGNYLKEMISVYAKNLKPLLLEGAVKSKVDKGERNAVIYLFIPETLLED